MAALTTLRLLRQLPPGAAADVRCVSFAAPAIGNARLQAYVRERGWERHFSNLLVPGAERPSERSCLNEGRGLVRAYARGAAEERCLSNLLVPGAEPGMTSCARRMPHGKAEPAAAG